MVTPDSSVVSLWNTVIVGIKDGNMDRTLNVGNVIV
jgi:hypothetical protein